MPRRTSDVPALIPYGRPRVHHAHRPGENKTPPTHPPRHSSPQSGLVQESVDNSNMASTGSGPSPAWPDQNQTGEGGGGDGQVSTSIENVASNFMARIQRTEEENANLLEDNQRLLAKSEIDGQEIKRLDMENKRLASDLDQALSGDENAKKELLVLQKRIAELEEQNENLVQAFKEERQDNKETIKDMQEEKDRLSQLVEQLQQNEQELDMKLTEQDDEIRDLQHQLSIENVMQVNQPEVDTFENDRLQEENNRLKDKLKHSDEAKLRADESLEQITKENDSLKDTVQKQKKAITEMKKSIGDLKKEKIQLENKLGEMKASFEQQKSKSADKSETDELRKKVTQLTKDKKALEQAMSKLKEEHKEGTAKHQEDAAELVRTKKLMKELAERVKLLKNSVTSMTELVQSKESHIHDLRDEVDDMRTKSAAVAAELERYRSIGDHDVLLSDKYQDMASSHRKALDENKRLRDLVAKQTMEETNAVSERSELQLELDVLREKNSASQTRIKQLEKWMDEIFNNETFEVVTKNGLSKVSSLPDIPRSEGGLTHRRGAPGGKRRTGAGVAGLGTGGIKQHAATSRAPASKAWSLAGGGRDTRGSTYR